MQNGAMSMPPPQVDWVFALKCHATGTTTINPQCNDGIGGKLRISGKAATPATLGGVGSAKEAVTAPTVANC